MAKYRIVSRNCNPIGELRLCSWYYLQVKILNRWWIDYYRLPLSNALDSCDIEYDKVVEFYDDNCGPNRKRQKVIRYLKMMNPEIKQKWIDALATYKQGKMRLRNQNDEFCCLGVLCDIYSKETGVEWKLSDDYIKGSMEIERCVSYLPIEVEKWAGLDSHNPMVKIESLGTFSLIWVNDSFNYTFPQIAELIREQL